MNTPTARIAVYAGSFDPLTAGHLSVIERGASLFDRLLVTVAVNPDKATLFSLDERLAMIRQAVALWPNVDACATRGYVVELARQHGARYLIRGVRGATDIDAEIHLAHLNHGLAPEIETVFVPAHPELSQVSSSGLKEKARRGENLEPWCTPAVARQLHERLAAQMTEVPHVDL